MTPQNETLIRNGPQRRRIGDAVTLFHWVPRSPSVHLKGTPAHHQLPCCGIAWLHTITVPASLLRAGLVVPPYPIMPWLVPLAISVAEAHCETSGHLGRRSTQYHWPSLGSPLPRSVPWQYTMVCLGLPVVGHGGAPCVTVPQVALGVSHCRGGLPRRVALLYS